MQLSPKIVSMACGDHCTDKFKKKNCLSNGKYCDMHAEDGGKMGMEFMLENLF